MQKSVKTRFFEEKLKKNPFLFCHFLSSAYIYTNKTYIYFY